MSLAAPATIGDAPNWAGRPNGKWGARSLLNICHEVVRPLDGTGMWESMVIANMRLSRRPFSVAAPCAVGQEYEAGILAAAQFGPILPVGLMGIMAGAGPDAMIE